MDRNPSEGPRASSIPGCYVWQVPGKPVTIYLELTLVDRVLPDVLRGLMAVPKRGAEVGGLLLGTVEAGEHPVIHIQDAEPVACEYKKGPSYVLSDQDLDAFDAAYQRWERTPDSSRYVVGYYRSHTRDGTGLGQQDLDLCSRYFADPADVVLLIRPFATRVSMAGFLFQENGNFQDAPYLEFPFRRRELEGGEAPPHRPLQETRTRGSEAAAQRRLPLREEQPPAHEAEEDSARPSYARAERFRQPEPAYVVTTPSKSRFEKRWVWIPLLFVFLLLGVLLGFQTALSITSRVSGGNRDPFSLGLAVSEAGGSLRVTWDRQAPAIKNAVRGLLEIQDGDIHTPMDLDSTQLQTLDNILYNRRSKHVRFRLEVAPKTSVTMAQTVDWDAK